MLWADLGRRENDAFVEVLPGHGERVHLFADLLTQALATDAGRRLAVDRVYTDQRFGPTLPGELRALFIGGPSRARRPTRSCARCSSGPVKGNDEQGALPDGRITTGCAPCLPAPIPIDVTGAQRHGPSR